MTVKRQWMLVLILTVVISVAVNSLVLSILIKRQFIDYSTENYNSHISQLEEFSKKILVENSYSRQQIAMQLESHLSDPINEIRLYDMDGNLLAYAASDRHQMMGMMGNRMMNRMMGNAAEEIDSIDIVHDDDTIGRLNIKRYSSIGNSLATRNFIVSLIGSSMLSFGIVFILIFVIGMIISNKMTKDLRLTAQQAVDIELGNAGNVPKSHVREIRMIQQSLETLQARLRLKQTSRKKLVDELVHQTRTPLTILSMHLEGFQDGVIKFTPDEIKTCELQIDNITSIITNMSGMIDAEKDIDSTEFDQIELYQMLKQIIGGLKMQFDKKGIDIQLLSQDKFNLSTDRYKLSQAVYNLLTNAYKFTGSRGKVTVDYGEFQDGVRIIIEDTGTGIRREEQSKIFDAYYRGSNSDDYSGEGIGLYVVKQNIAKIGGNIEVESEPGKGSRFVIWLPA